MAAGHREAARSVLDGGECSATLGQTGATAETLSCATPACCNLHWEPGCGGPSNLDIHIDFAVGSHFDRFCHASRRLRRSARIVNCFDHAVCMMPSAMPA